MVYREYGSKGDGLDGLVIAGTTVASCVLKYVNSGRLIDTVLAQIRFLRGTTACGPNL